MLATHTGLRRDEWRFLPWDDVSLDTGHLVIRSERNKSKRDDSLPLHPAVVKHLRKLRDTGPLVRYWAGADRELSQQVLYAEWKRLQELAGIGGYSFHNLRDTCLTWYAAGMSEAQLHLFSRHADFATTKKHYLQRAGVLNGCFDGVKVPEYLID